MSDLGTIDRDLFDTVVDPERARTEKTDAGAAHGIADVIDVGGDALVTATDPLSVLPDLGFERAGRFALDVVLADDAVSGIPPRISQRRHAPARDDRRRTGGDVARLR